MTNVDVDAAVLIDQAARTIGQPGVPALVARAEVHSHPRVSQVGGGPSEVHLGIVNLRVSPALALRYAAELIVAAKKAMEANRARTLANLAHETEPELPEPCCDKHRRGEDHVADEEKIAGPRLCSVCRSPQFLTRSGWDCDNGHGGADPL